MAESSGWLLLIIIHIFGGCMGPTRASLFCSNTPGALYISRRKPKNPGGIWPWNVTFRKLKHTWSLRRDEEKEEEWSGGRGERRSRVKEPSKYCRGGLKSELFPGKTELFTQHTVSPHQMLSNVHERANGWLLLHCLGFQKPARDLWWICAHTCKLWVVGGIFWWKSTLLFEFLFNRSTDSHSAELVNLWQSLQYKCSIRTGAGVNSPFDPS